jgi:hypothetical protein
VVLDGSSLASTTSPSFLGDGLYIVSAANTVAGQAIVHFPSAGIEVSGPSTDQNIISANFIGTADDATAQGNVIGVLIDDSAHDNTIGSTFVRHGNTISGNSANGIVIEGGASFNHVNGNRSRKPAAETDLLIQYLWQPPRIGPARCHEAEGRALLRSGSTWHALPH